MKLKTKTSGKAQPRVAVAVASLVNNLAPGTVIVHMHQSIRQSANYNSAEAGMSLTCVVADDDDAIKAAQDRLTALIEDPLSAKFKEQAKVLQALAK